MRERFCLIIFSSLLPVGIDILEPAVQNRQLIVFADDRVEMAFIQTVEIRDCGGSFDLRIAAVIIHPEVIGSIIDHRDIVPAWENHTLERRRLRSGSAEHRFAGRNIHRTVAVVRDVAAAKRTG